MILTFDQCSSAFSGFFFPFSAFFMKYVEKAYFDLSLEPVTLSQKTLTLAEHYAITALQVFNALKHWQLGMVNLS